MPKKLEAKLKAEYPGNDHVVYGTLNALGLMHGNQETAKGRAMDAKAEKKPRRARPSNLGNYLHPRKAR